MIVPSDAAAESTEDNLVEDLVRDEDNERTSEDNPATGEEDGSKSIEEVVTIGGRLSVAELDLENTDYICLKVRMLNLPCKWSHYLQEKL